MQLSHLSLASALAIMLCPQSAEALETTAKTRIEAPDNSRNYINMRVGSTSSNRNSHPEICLETSPLSFFSIEACGTGTGILHTDPAPSSAHFRTKFKALQWNFNDWDLSLFGGLGFAEFQIGEDAPGFIFSGVGKDRVETAGAEVSAHLRTLIPVYKGFDLLTEFTVSGAYVPYAPDLITPLSSFQPAFSLTIGAGF